MHRERAIRVALTCGAALLLWLSAATMDTRQPAPSPAVGPAASAEPAATPAPASDVITGVAQIFESALAFLREISRGLERGGYTGAVIRLLIVVEVLIAAVGVVSSVTVGGQIKADLVYRIVDVMGALFIIIVLLLLGMTAI
jgi:hypothetical protein